MSVVWTCLIVDLTESGLAETFDALAAAHDFGMPATCLAVTASAQARLNAGDILVQIILSKTFSPDVQTLLKTFQSNVGCIAEFQALVCDEPDPVFMAGAFEFGIEQFVGTPNWLAEAAAIARNAIALVNDPTSAEARTVTLSRSIRSADQAAIQNAEKQLGDLAEYDYRAAFAKGKACEATGDYARAAEAYGTAKTMNKMFRPSATCLGETLLVAGRYDEALDVFKQLEKTNPFDVERKANIASVYVEKGDFAMAERYVAAAAKLSPGNSRVLEAQAQVLLCTGKVGDAFKLMDSMSEVGPFFAAKLNELGIQLSQAGKGKSALALYQKAHKIVRPELRYKISLNAALACRRLQAWDMALKFIARCEKEYGRSFPKLEKIRLALVQSKAEAAKNPKPATGIDEAS